MKVNPNFQKNKTATVCQMNGNIIATIAIGKSDISNNNSLLAMDVMHGMRYTL